MTTPHTPPAALPDALSGVALEALAQAIDAHGVRSLDDALVMADDICDPNTGDVERLMRHGGDVVERLAAEVRRLAALRAQHAADVAAAVAGERARAVALRDAATDLAETLSKREDACRASAKDAPAGEVRSRLMGKTSAYGHAAELLTRVLIDADAIAAPTGGGE